MTAEQDITVRISAIGRRVADLERIAQRGASPVGFHVTRTTNDAGIVTSGVDDITWNHVVEATWSTLDGFTTGDVLTVPPGAGGMYVFAAEVFWGTNLGSVLLSVSKNATFGLVQVFGAPAVDRWSLCGVGRLAPGDDVRLRMFNGSGSTLTPTAVTGDSVTPASPMLRAWRISL